MCTTSRTAQPERISGHTHFRTNVFQGETDSKKSTSKSTLQCKYNGHPRALSDKTDSTSQHLHSTRRDSKRVRASLCVVQNEPLRREQPSR
eukprot:53504-Rhodomonas_salina.2